MQDSTKRNKGTLKEGRDYEIDTDGKVVWVNGPTALVGRFSKSGIDVHVDGACVGDSCSPGPCSIGHWQEFQQKMIQYHDIEVPNKYMPDYLRDDMADKKKKPLNKSEMARKILEYFGPDGKKWSNEANVANKCCLLEVTYRLFGKNDCIIDKELCERLQMTDTNDVGKWQDQQEWATIKRLLNSIRDRRKFNMKSKKAAQESRASA